MLQSAVDNEVITKVGDVFYISMTHWDRGNYVMANHVVAFVQDRHIAWEPVVHSYENPEYKDAVGGPGLREWGWQLEPLSDRTTRVTEYFEGSRLPEGLRKFIEDGEFWRPAMVTSLANLERMATMHRKIAAGRHNPKRRHDSPNYFALNDWQGPWCAETRVSGQPQPTTARRQGPRSY